MASAPTTFKPDNRSGRIRPWSLRGIFRRFLFGDCCHRLALISASVAVWPEGIIPHEPVSTIVLRRCIHCGHHETFVLYGIHAIEALLQTKSEIEELEGIWR